VRWLGVPRTRIEPLSNEETGVTADTALRLSKVFGTSPELRLNLQIDYEIRIAKRQIGKDLAKIAPSGQKPPGMPCRKLAGSAARPTR
jgi:antitoxin HigA-1